MKKLLKILGLSLALPGLFAMFLGGGNAAAVGHELDASSFMPRVNFLSERDPSLLAVGDLDGDGKPEMITVNYQSNILSIFRNTGHPGQTTPDSFAPRVDFPAGPSPASVAVGDLDGDGKLDVVVANDYGANISVYRNISPPGNISFADPIHFAAGTHPVSVGIADLDGDGKSDIVVVNAVLGPSTVGVFQNLTTPGSTELSFAAMVEFPTGDYSFNLAVGDLDSDGKPDLAVANEYSTSVSLLRNASGPGSITPASFEPSIDLPVAGRAFFVSLGDLDGDGKPEVAVAHDGGLSLFRNLTGAGTWTAESFGPSVELPTGGTAYDVAMGDLDGDGKLDLAVTTLDSPGVSVFQNRTSGSPLNSASFGPKLDFAGPANSVVISDLDGDGKADLVTARNPYLSVYQNAAEVNSVESGGTVHFANFSTSLVFDADGVTRLPVGSDYSVQLYAGPSADSLQSVGAAVHIAPVPGRFVGGTRTIPTVAPMQTATVQVRAWESAAGSSFEEARASGGKTGVSPLLEVITGGGGVPPRPPATLTGLQSFSLTVNVERTLSVLSPPNRNPGDLVEVPVQLASSGDVGGMTFLLHYDPDYLSVPEVSWDATLAGALRQVNIPSLGLIRMVFALPATTVPAGAQTLATVSFRARTVLADATTALRLQIVDAALPTGEPILHGTGVVPGSATILAGPTSPGDNNGNDHIDIGDVTLLLRLLAQMDSIRPWDIPRNDLNQNGLLDSGDVIKMLRAASAIDAPPPPPEVALEPGAEATPAAGTPLPGPVAMLTPVRSSGTAGQLVTVQVRLQSLLKPISGVTFTLHYPVAALRLTGPPSHRTGPVVPGDAVAIWNVAPAQNNYETQDGRVTLAVSTPTPWPADGVLAELTFAVQPGATAQHLWPLTLTSVEVTGNGFDPRPVASLSYVFIGRKPLPSLLGNLRKLLSGECHLTLSGDAGATYRIEASEDLLHWTTLTDIVNRTGTMSFSDVEAANHPKRFYRTRPLD